jgi:hypothetical protein
MSERLDGSHQAFSIACRSCGAAATTACGYHDAVAFFCWLRINDAFAATAAWRAGLLAIRDRYVKQLPGQPGPRCLLCGNDDGTHDARYSCGIAAEALAT